MIRRNWIVVFTVLMITCWTMAFYVSLRAEDETSTEDEIEDVSEDIEPSVDDIPLLIDDIRDEVEKLEELQKQNNDDMGIYHKDTSDKFDVLIEILTRDLEGEEKEEPKNIDDNTEVLEETRGEELTKNGEEESTEASTEVDGSNDDIPVDASDQIDLLQIHQDIQKLMLSIWAIAGLFLGSKLISRMFGNG